MVLKLPAQGEGGVYVIRSLIKKIGGFGPDF